MASRRATGKRGFGEISRLPSGRYRARYTGPDRNRHSAPITFVAKIDAEGWLVEQEQLISRGEWRPPDRQVREAPLLLGEYAAVVVGRRRLRPATAALYAKLLRLTKASDASTDADAESSKHPRSPGPHQRPPLQCAAAPASTGWIEVHTVSQAVPSWRPSRPPTRADTQWLRLGGAARSRSAAVLPYRDRLW
jgi:hypothetical protein